jgi:glycine betaine/proline transport system substrate-binding protein
MAISSPAWAQNGDRRPIVLGQVYLSFYAVTGSVVHEVLERLGHTVEVREGPHEKIFPLLGEGAIDLMAAVWLPEGHRDYWIKYGANAVEVAKLFEDARFFWGVPDYVPEDEVASIADLSKPEVAARMSKTIQGIGMGATISTYSVKAVSDYKLNGLGYVFRPGTPTEWTGAYDAASNGKKWIVFPTWAPQYLNRGGKIRPLKDPQGVLGGSNRAVLVGPRNRVAALPGTTRAVLSRIQLGLDGVTEMDWLVNVKKRTPREAAQTWMAANKGLVEGWMHT